MWLLLLACASPPPAKAPPPPAESPAPPPPWVLVGRAVDNGLATPSLAGGAAALGPGCAAINERIKGDGPPCFIEDWASARVVRVERAGERLRFDGALGRTRWSQLEGPFAGCLGDPLAVPPAGDPGATRALDGNTWVLTFSGQNRCGIGGSLRLSALRNAADWSTVTVGGAPWAKGGREAALSYARAELRALVADKWSQLDREQREDALRSLATDPHPDAVRILKRRK